MAIKSFVIQGADLTLGGVNLQAGTTGVVIPGVTQATNYFVEEVSETGEQTNTLNLPIVIDNVTHAAKVENAGASVSAYATYSAQLDNEDYIDNLEVNTSGTYVGSEVNLNANFDMWGYTGSDAEGYLTNWVTGDWVQIPFRPKMRAGEIANISGGDRLVNGDNELVLSETGHLTFPDGSVQVTAYTGAGDDNIWIETFASDAPTTDFVQAAISVEYDADGNIIALFNHIEPGTNSTYASVAKLTPTGAVLWQVRFSANLNTDGWGMAYDTVDNYVYVAGRTSGTPLTYEFATLTKLNGLNGSIVWSKTYDFEADSSSAVVEVDSDGNPIMVGYAYNGTDTYIVTTKINQADGTVVWSKTLDGQGYDEAYGMATGPANEIVTIGYVDTFGVLDAAATLYSDPASNANWTSTLNSISVDGLTADFEFVAGVPTFTNVVDLTGGRLLDAVLITVDGSQLGGVTGVDDLTVKVATLATNDIKDRMVVIKYATDGTIAWQKAVQFDTGYDCFGADADIDADGNIYVCGSYQFDIGGGNTDSAMSLVKFNSSGVKQWSRRVVGNCQTFATSVVVGDDNQLYLSGVTGNNSTSDFIWVVAKYTTDGVVEWQRLIDNTTTWTFGGALWFSSVGGSNIAVKNGYVALAGSFGDPGTQPLAVVAQIDTDATPFSVGDWDIKGASFGGLLNASASDIIVVDANKTLGTASPAVGTFASGEDLSNFLTVTRYSNSGSGTGDVTFIENKIIGTGSNDGYLGLNLAPGPNLASDMYFRIHGGDYPTHLHLSVGNTSVYDQYFGTDSKYLKLGLDDVISIGTNSNTWTFDTDGTTILPGAVVNSTAAKTGSSGIPGSGQVATLTLGTTNNTNFTPGIYPGIGILAGTGYTITLTVAGNGDLTAEVTASGTGFNVGNQANLLGAGITGGSSPADDIILTVATLSNVVVATALDLTNSVNKLANGYYALADGVEGQVMYLVRQNGSVYNSIVVNVANARVDGALNTTIDYYPFDNGVIPLNMSTLIFTGGAWQADNGSWD